MIESAIRRGPRYLAVGLFCAVLSNAIMIAVAKAGGHSLMAVTASVVVLIPTGFALQALVTFRQPFNWPAFVRYAGVMVWNWPLFCACIWLLHDLCGVPMPWAAPITTVLSFLWNYRGSAWAILWRPAESLGKKRS
jgi:putative flippase GtrA